MKQATTTKLLRVLATGGAYYRLDMENPFGDDFQPGQFLMLSAETSNTFLKRPYSIHRRFIDENGVDTLALLIKNVGKQTAFLSKLPAGSPLEIVGPLGTAFEVEEGLKKAIFVAGGIGAAPFAAFADSGLLDGVGIIALIGGRSKEDLQGIEPLKERGALVLTATEDGSAGEKGLVTKLLERVIGEHEKESTAIYACGPEPMMKAVGKIAREQAMACILSLEAHMGCGFGVCLGCVVKNNEGRYIRVCTEGAVISADKLADYGFAESLEGSKK